MSALLTQRGVALAFFVFAMVGTLQAQLIVDGLTAPNEKGPGSFEVLSLIHISEPTRPY